MGIPAGKERDRGAIFETIVMENFPQVSVGHSTDLESSKSQENLGTSCINFRKSETETKKHPETRKVREKCTSLGKKGELLIL